MTAPKPAGGKDCVLVPRETLERVKAALAEARDFLAADLNDLLRSFAEVRNDEPDLSTIDESDKPFIEREQARFANVEAALVALREIAP